VTLHPQGSSLSVRVYEAWHRMYDLLQVEPGSLLVPAKPELLTAIRPTIDIFRLLEIPQTLSANLDLSGSAGTFVTAFTVPATERWVLQSVAREGTTSNARVAIRDGITNIHVNLTVPATAEESTNGLQLTLDKNWLIGMFTNADAGDNSINLRVFFTKLVMYRE